MVKIEGKKSLKNIFNAKNKQKNCKFNASRLSSQSYKSFSPTLFSRALFFIFSLVHTIFFIILSLLWPSYISDAIIQFTIDWDSRAPAWNFPTSVLSNGKARKWKRLKKCSENRKESNITFDEHDGNNIKKNEWMRNNARYVNVHINTIWIVFRANCCTHTFTYPRPSVAESLLLLPISDLCVCTLHHIGHAYNFNRFPFSTTKLAMVII